MHISTLVHGIAGMLEVEDMKLAKRNVTDNTGQWSSPELFFLVSNNA